MPIEITEEVKSPVADLGINPSAERRYKLSGTTDDAEARAALWAFVPAEFDLYGDGGFILNRQNLHIEPADGADDIWLGTVKYGTDAAPTTGGDPQEQSEFTFDTTGGTQHITQALQEVARYAPAPLAAAPMYGAIGVTADGVEGVDITVPVFQWSRTHYLPAAFVTDAYIATLYNLTGKVNNALWKGFQAGEVKFMGARGGQRGVGDWAITFSFAAQPNVTGRQIGDITGIAKEGWQYLWVLYRDHEDTTSKRLVKKPIAVYIDQVCEYGNFAALGI